MADEVKTKLTVEGAEALQELERVKRAEEEHAQAIERTGKAAEDATRISKQKDRAASDTVNAQRDVTNATQEGTDAVEDQADAMKSGDEVAGSFIGTLRDMTAGIAGAAGIAKVFQAWREEIDLTSEALLRNEEIVRRNAEARLDLAALGGFENPAELAEIDREAIRAGRSPGEVARLATFAKSVFPDGQFSDQQRSDFLTQVATIGQTSSASLPEIAGALYPLVLEGASAVQAGNIYQAGVRQAGEPDPAKFAAAAAQTLAIGKEIGGLDLGESYGYAAGALSLGLPSPERAVTGLNALILGIRTPQNDQGKELLERYGITSDTSLDESLELLSQGRAAGEVSDSDIVNLAGREGLAVAAKLLQPEQLKGFQSRVRAVDRAEDIAGNLAQEQSAGINKLGSIQGFNLLAKQGEAETEVIRAGDVEAARRAAAREQLTALLAEKVKAGEISEADATIIAEEFSYLLAQGRTIEQAIDSAEQLQSGVRVPLPIPTTDSEGKPVTILEDANLNPIKRAIGSDRGIEDFLKKPLLERLRKDPSAGGAPQPTLADPADQQGALGLSPSLGQTAGLGDMSMVLYELTETLRQQRPTVINYNGPVNAHDPIVGDLDGRDR